jgi:hypothetical protein
VISNLRQAWINALRDDLAEYLKEIDVMHFEQLGTDHLETRGRAFLVYRRILLRLNIKEDLHVQLAGRLEDLLNIGDIITPTTSVLTRPWPSLVESSSKNGTSRNTESLRTSRLPRARSLTRAGLRRSPP